MRTVTAAMALLTVLWPAAQAWSAEPSGTSDPPRLLAHLPREPVLVSLYRVDDLGRTLESLLDFAGRWGEDTDRASLDAALAEFDERVGCSLQADLLARIGPEVGVVLDVPPIDPLIDSMRDPETAVGEALARVGLVARVRDERALDACLRKLFDLVPGVLSEEDGLVRLRVPAADGPGSSEAPEATGLSVYYGLRDGVLALGVSPVFVRASLAPREAGQRLSDGADFSRVFSHLDRAPQSAVYLNLPRLRELVLASSTLQALIQADDEIRDAVGLFLSADFTTMGAGTTSVEIDGGTRTTTFGPSGLSGAALAPAVVAGVAVPNLLNAIDRGRQKRTMADIRSVGIACESYSLDHDRYPGPTDGWVPVDQLAGAVEPVYIRELPRTDGWGRPLMYRSDGASYRIGSWGKDGVRESDVAGEAVRGATSEFDSDIVFGDGEFLAWPEGEQH